MWWEEAAEGVEVGRGCVGECGDAGFWRHQIAESGEEGLLGAGLSSTSGTLATERAEEVLDGGFGVVGWRCVTESSLALDI